MLQVLVGPVTLLDWRAASLAGEEGDRPGVRPEGAPASHAPTRSAKEWRVADDAHRVSATLACGFPVVVCDA